MIYSLPANVLGNSYRPVDSRCSNLIELGIAAVVGGIDTLGERNRRC
jgi:hypothetical protein